MVGVANPIVSGEENPGKIVGPRQAPAGPERERSIELYRIGTWSDAVSAHLIYLI